MSDPLVRLRAELKECHWVRDEDYAMVPAGLLRDLEDEVADLRDENALLERDNASLDREIVALDGEIASLESELRSVTYDMYSSLALP